MLIHHFRTAIFLLSFVLFSQFALAQDISDKIDSFTRKDDAASLSQVINQQNINDCYADYTALAIAIRNNAEKCVDMLLKADADANKVCNNYKSPVFFAVKYGDLKMVEKLVAKGAKLDGEYNKQSLADYAKRYGKEDIVKYLESKK